MTTGAWPAALHGTLTGPARPATVLLVEGPAGTGKSHLVAGLRRRHPAGSAGRTLSCADLSEDDARRAFDAVARSTAPTLLVVEDVHRADEPVSRRLRQLARTLPAGCVLVLTWRPEDLPAGRPPLGEPLDCPPGTTVLRERTGPLTAPVARQLIGRTLGDRCPAEVVDRLYALTGGVAQVLVDVLPVLAEAAPAEPTADGLGALEAPPRLSERVLARLAALPPDARRLVRAAAVLDGPASEPELAALTGLSAAEVRAGLLAALGAAVLTDLGPRRYGFPVPLAARAVTAGLPSPERFDLHHRAAQVLRRRTDVPWPAVAGHLRAAGVRRGLVRAAERAAGAHAAAGEHREAARLLRELLVDRRIPGPARARLATTALRHLAGLTPRDASTLLDTLARTPGLPGPLRAQARVLRGLSLCTPTAPDHDGWLRLARTAGTLPGELGLAARVLAAMSMPHWPGIPLAEHRNFARRAVAAVATSTDPVLRAAVDANLVALLLTLDDPGAEQTLLTLDALDTLDDPGAEQAPPRRSPHDGSGPGSGPGSRTGDGTAQERRDETDGESDGGRDDESDGDDRAGAASAGHRARALCNAADATLWLGRYEDSRAFLDRGAALAARHRAGPHVAHGIRSIRLLLDWATGRWTGLADRAAELVADTAPTPVLGHEARTVLASLCLARGEWSQSRAWLAGGPAPHPDQQLAPVAVLSSTVLVRLALARDDHEDARTHAVQAWARLRGKGIWAWAAELAPWAVTAALGAGDAATARAMVEDLRTAPATPHLPLAAAARRWCRATLAEHDGDLAGAAAAYRAGADAYAALPRPYLSALAAEAAARCAAAGGADRLTANHRPTDQDVLDGLTGALRVLTDLGATHDAARVRSRLRAVTPPRSGRPAHPGLSPREREVAELAATGLTNRRIAAELHLSTRTVENHVARALRKLAVPSRRDLPPHL
ncbi:LuxR C-terminal-related transcriptional regulator [Kitasatospora sp. NPDC089797]|uniref:helix-turn-helix transcriptional regulator n=1 Tax=Kitasatospora sp. NPDC089797 TaxID=3155298 RepID=UPI00341521DA